MAETRLNENMKPSTTVVTAGDRAFAWGALILVASMRRGVEKFCGKSLAENRYQTRINAPFIVIHRKWRPFLERWQSQIGNVLPADVAIIMKHGSPYFQTDESVLGSLLFADWLVEKGVVKPADLPIPLRRSMRPFCRAARVVGLARNQAEANCSEEVF